MTIDFHTREEVNTTTSQVEQALTLPVDPSIRHEVRRFGFEYEMLPPGHQDRYTDNGVRIAALDEHMDAWRQAREENDEYGYDEDDDENAFEAERASFMHQYRRAHGLHAGMEATGGPMDLIHRAYANGLIAENSRHSYHCDCDSCDYRRTSPLMTAQSDCTVAVEFVSRVIDLSDFDRAALDIQTWVEMMNDWDDDGGWMPDGNTSCGNHVHVSADGDDQGWWPLGVRESAYHNINALYAAFDWNEIADGGCGRIRGYNSKPQVNNTYGTGNWLSDRGYGTFEHRLWNTPREPRRLWAHIGISIGLQRWGFNIAQAMPDLHLWSTATPDRYGDSQHRMTDEVYNALTTNVGEIVRGIRAYIPQHDQFDIARDLIVNLTPTL